MSSSGGGSSSWTEIPEYLENTHWALLANYNPSFGTVGTQSLGTGAMDVMRAMLDPDGNPYNTQADDGFFSTTKRAYNPETNLESMKQGYDRIKDNALASFPRSATVEEYILSATNTIERNVLSALESTLGGQVDSILTAASSKASSMISSANTNVRGVNRDKINSNIENTSRMVKSEMASLIHEAVNSTALNLGGDAKSSIEDVISAAITKASTNLSSLIDEAVQKAAEVTASSVVSDMVDAFESKTNTRHLRGLGRFAAQAAVGGAANSSAMFIGQALMESERATDVSDFEAKLKFQLFNEVLGLYANKGDSTVNTFMQAYIAEYGLRLQEFQMKFTEMVKAFLMVFSESVQSHQAIMVSELGLATGVSIEQMGRYYQLYQSNLHNKNMMILDLLKAKMEGDFRYTHAYSDAEKFLAEIERMSIVAYKEQYDRDIELRIGDISWDLSVIQRGANLLGAVSGSVVGGSETRSAQASSLGGALSGAVAGAEIGSVGGGYGTAAGAIIGAIAGYFAAGS